MEWTKKWKKNRNLTKRILLCVTGILAAAMSISTLGGYIFFRNVVREQEIEDEQARLEQVYRQMEVNCDDIFNFAVSIVADESMQNAIREKGEQTAFDKVKRVDTISKRLSFFSGFRMFLSGSFIELEDGEVVTHMGYQEDYWKEKLETPEVKAYREHPEYIFSDPYHGLDAWEAEQMFCYRFPFRDIYSAEERMGILYLEIAGDYLLEPVMQYGDQAEHIWLTGNAGKILYQNSEEFDLDVLISDLPEYTENGIHKTSEGYLMTQQIEGTGWQLYTLVTNQLLWNRTSFVLNFFVISFVISVAVMLVALSRILRNVIRPISLLSEKMSQEAYEELKELEIVQTNDEIQTLYECYNSMIQVIHQGIEDRIAYEKRSRQMEFDILLSQIHPHYLYNVLNTVVYLASAGKNKEVVRISQALIYSLQETLRLGEKNIETDIDGELRLLESYLDIQRFRYPDMFEVKIDCPEVYKSYIVPKTVLQPLVENAIVHGILPSEEDGTVWVKMEENESGFCVTVEDNGAGIDEERLELFDQRKKLVDEKSGRVHIGISNIRDRIEHLYGSSYGMKIERKKDGGTRVVLHLPVKKAEKAKNL